MACGRREKRGDWGVNEPHNIRSKCCLPRAVFTPPTTTTSTTNLRNSASHAHTHTHARARANTTPAQSNSRDIPFLRAARKRHALLLDGGHQRLVRHDLLLLHLRQYEPPLREEEMRSVAPQCELRVAVLRCCGVAVLRCCGLRPQRYGEYLHMSVYICVATLN